MELKNETQKIEPITAKQLTNYLDAMSLAPLLTDKEKDIMYLYSSSADFGYVNRETLIDAIENGMMRPSLQKTKFFHSFFDFLDAAMIDENGIWIQHKLEEDVQ